MAEGQVTVDGVTRPLTAPFLVIATENPIDLEGTPSLEATALTARTTATLSGTEFACLVGRCEERRTVR
jgi:ATPase family associated with various cellular activities (AAA)